MFGECNRNGFKSATPEYPAKRIGSVIRLGVRRDRAAKDAHLGEQRQKGLFHMSALVAC